MDTKNKKWKTVIEKKKEELKSAFQNYGVAGLSQAIMEDLNGWKNENINIAVLGQSGVGKSSFINALLGLKPDDEGAATVGCAETTAEKQSYVHPKNKKFLIWDYPGVGTKKFPREEYLVKVDFRIFDFFILITSKRFCEYDIWLAHAVDMTGKNFYFVRSMFGNDLENEVNKRRKNRITRDELQNSLYKKVFDDCEKNLEYFDCQDRIFIIDSYEKNSFDFAKLESRIIHDALGISEKKHTAITLSLSAMTKSAIEEKKVVLEKRIPGTALRAAFASYMSSADLRILMEEKELYRNQFKLDALSLEQDAKASNIQEQLSVVEFDLYCKETKSVENEELMNEIDGLIPFLIPFVNVVKTYKACKTWLKKTLDGIVQSAVEVNETMIKGLAKS